MITTLQRSLEYSEIVGCISKTAMKKVLLISFVTISFTGCSGIGNQRVMEPELVVAPEHRESRSHNRLIKPGQGISNVTLGDSFNQILKMLNSQPVFDNTYDFAGCKSRRATWYVGGKENEKLNDLGGSFFNVIFDDSDRAVHISTEGQFFDTQEKIKGDDTLDEFFETYSDLNVLVPYVDRGLSSNSKYVIGSSVYFVNPSGIAFEFRKERDGENWRIGSITVFLPNKPFVPRFNCYSVDSEFWVRLPSLDIKGKVFKD